MPELRLTCGKKISIHAPARGATFCHLLALLNTRNFNPRSREGSDSFAAPTLNLLSNFNPRSREGSDGDCV